MYAAQERGGQQLKVDGQLLRPFNPHSVISNGAPVWEFEHADMSAILDATWEEVKTSSTSSTAVISLCQ